MRQRQIGPVNTRLLKVGLEVFPVYGDERSGWSMDPIDLTPDTPKWLRYDSLDELFFELNFDPAIAAPDADPKASMGKALLLLEEFAPGPSQF